MLAVDACIGAGLETPEPSPATVEALAGQVPEGARLSNPFELTWEAGPDAYRAAVSAALADDAFDSVMVLYAAPVLPRPAEVASAVGDARAGADKPVIATFLGSEPGDEVDGVQPGLPIFRFPSEGARTLGRLAAYGEWRARPAGTLPMPDEIGLDVAAVQARVAEVLAADPDGRTLEHAEAADLLALAGLPACPTAVVRGPDEAVAAAQAMGYPVVLKASGVGRYHRGEVGGVALDLHDDDSLRAAFGRMVTTLHSAMDPAIVQKAAPAGADVLVAGQQHPTFGGVVTVGLGGAAAAANADLPVRVVPALRHRGRRAGGGVAGRRAAGGPRGRGPGVGRQRRAVEPAGALRRPARARAGAGRGRGQPGDRGPRRCLHHRRVGAGGAVPAAVGARGPSPRRGARVVPRPLTR